MEAILSITAADCRWEYFRGTGAGGQKRNKTSNCVRVTHDPSGAVGEARDSRSQRTNREVAFHKMAESAAMQKWIRLEVARRTGKLLEINEAVDRAMRSVKVEGKDENGRWVVLTAKEEEPCSTTTTNPNSTKNLTR